MDILDTDSLAHILVAVVVAFRILEQKDTSDLHVDTAVDKLASAAVGQDSTLVLVVVDKRIVAVAQDNIAAVVAIVALDSDHTCVDQDIVDLEEAVE